MKYTLTPLTAATRTNTSAVTAPSSLELALPAGLGLMVGSALGPVSVGDGLGEGLGEAEACNLRVCLFFLAPGCWADAAVDWVAVGVGDGGGVLGLDE